MAFSANNQRRRDEQARRFAALSPEEKLKELEELRKEGLELAAAGKKALAKKNSSNPRLPPEEQGHPDHCPVCDGNKNALGAIDLVIKQKP